MNENYDLLIIGSGPAGLAAAIYAARADLRALTFELSYASGGQMLNSWEIDNYPGLPKISGMELSDKMRAHADSLGAVIVNEEVVSIEADGEIKRVITTKGEYTARGLVIATGASHRKLGAPGEERLAGMGVSYCATCDGAFFRNRTVAVVGGGDTAVEDALFLARGCKKVYLIHRRDKLRAAKSISDRLAALENTEFVLESQIAEIIGSDAVEKIDVVNNSGEHRILDVDGVFIAVGISPVNTLVNEKLKTNKGGYVVAGEDGRTSVDKVYVAGDLRAKALRQVITAAADGANCITSFLEDIQNYAY